MEEKAKDVWQKVKGTVGGLSRTVKGIIIAGVVVTLVVVAIVLATGSKTESKELFTNLTGEDMTRVCAYLTEIGADFEVRGEDTIMVPADQEAKLKAGVIGGGYLDSGANYNLYLDNISSLSTESDRAQLTLYQIQERLEATIRNLEGVHDATVNIALGEDRRFVLSQDSTLEASASVIVTMTDDAPINAKLAEAIKNAVSHAVKGLDIDQVDIRDSQGNTYDGTDGGDVSDVAAKRMELEDSMNKRLTRQVLGLLEPMYGTGNVAVAVNTTVGMSSSYSESTEYSVPDWAEDNDYEGILKRKIWEGSLVPGDDAAGGPVGTQPNADIPGYFEDYQPTGDEDSLSGSGEKEFENNKTVTQSQRMAGYIEDVTVSVTINSDVPNQASIDALVGHVANAVGLTQDQTDKISVLAAPFWSPEEDNQPADTQPMLNPLGDVPLWVYLALLAGLFLFMTLFAVFILLGRRRSRRQIQQLEPAVEMGPPVILEPIEEEPEPAGADIMDVHTEKSMELRRSVRELAESNPEIAAQAIKALLRGDEDSNA
ncbi:flagellar M-ring protein FliF C-terminal domain-containing protein [Acutalibacter muris]|uniref:flagellar M-ring protein FliF C-terminal domain-containing protein n=1 Tax=Acutalibacter muris TaxID=1796620 RepID=UPI00272DB545|nr:flagellar M-ring protein FliF C-terminal domain-containing protein [Acutalibacter muris]MCI9192088.1 flagellar M-ring protein FliF [Acutalibacter muris]